MFIKSTGQRVQKAFSDSAPQYEALSGLQQEIGRRLIERLGNVPEGGRILDVGMGTGQTTSRLASVYPRATVTGLDFAPGMVRQAAGRYAGFTAVQADAAALPFADRMFDAVFSNLAYQWMENMDEALGRACGVLKDNGVLCAAMFARETLRELFEAIGRTSPGRTQSASLTLRRLPSADAVSAALVRAGFVNVRVEEEVRTTHFKNMLALLRWLKATGANTPGVRIFIGKQWLQDADAYYRRTFASGEGVTATFQVVWVRAEKKKKG